MVVCIKMVLEIGIMYNGLLDRLTKYPDAFSVYLCMVRGNHLVRPGVAIKLLSEMSAA